MFEGDEFQLEQSEISAPGFINSATRFLPSACPPPETVTVSSNVHQIKIDQTERALLILAQIARLLDEGRASTNNHTYPVALVCLATGVHWDEAESLSRGSNLWG